jgi:hypothetical protein
VREAVIGELIVLEYEFWYAHHMNVIVPNADKLIERNSTDIYYFGYGAGRDKKRMAAIIRHQPEGGLGAILNNYRLYIQKLDDIPEIPQKILSDIWGSEFRAYTVRKSQGRVAGVIWKLSALDIKRVKEWEFVGLWRELVQIEVDMYNGQVIKAITDVAAEPSSVSVVVDGINYQDNLNYNAIHENSVTNADDDEYRMKEIAKIRNLIQSVDV